MLKETEKFIKDRKPFVGNLNLNQIPNVIQVGGGVPNACYMNAHSAKEEAQKIGKQVAIVSGWIVNEFDAKNNCVSIIAHWWNRDVKTNVFFDTTPLTLIGKSDYVQDSEIFMFCVKNDSRLDIHQHFSLAYIDGTYEVLSDEVNFKFKKISSLKTENFYNLN
jgi:hypothetical protein